MKPAWILTLVSAVFHAAAKTPGKDQLLMALSRFWFRKSEHAVLYALFKGPNPQRSRGCKACVVCGVRLRMLMLFWMANSIIERLSWEEWPSKIRSYGLSLPHSIRNTSSNHLSPISSSIHPLAWWCRRVPCEAARVLKPCSDLDVFPFTMNKEDILLPAAFTQAITVILVRQDDVRPTTVFEPFSAIIRTGWCSKLFPVSSQIHMHEDLDSRPRCLVISQRSWKYLVISGFVILALVVLSFSGLRIESVGCIFINPASQSFPGIFRFNCPASSFFFLQRVPTRCSNCRLDMSIPCLGVSFYAFAIFSSISGGIAVRLPGLPGFLYFVL